MLRRLAADLALKMAERSVAASRANLRRSAWWANVHNRFSDVLYVEMPAHAGTVKIERTDLLDDIFPARIAGLVRDHADEEGVAPEVIVREAMTAYLGLAR